MQQNAPFCVLLKKIPFVHGFIVLYLNFCVLLKKIISQTPPPLPLLVFQDLACILYLTRQHYRRTGPSGEGNNRIILYYIIIIIYEIFHNS